MTVVQRWPLPEDDPAVKGWPDAECDRTQSVTGKQSVVIARGILELGIPTN